MRVRDKHSARLAALSAVTVAALITLVHVPAASAQTDSAAVAEATKTSTAAPTEAAEAKTGLVPVPDYSGDLANRAHLLGDFGGKRQAWADDGVQFNADWVQTAQSVVDGGRDTGTKYGGSLDYLLTLDLNRMGVLPGAMIKVRAESRYGESVNTMSGTILPVDTDGFFPLTSPADEGIPITVTDLTYYQFLSPKIGLIAGKLDTLNSDLNEFASGRGNSQFLNTQLIFSSTLALMPYSTVGGGILLLPNEHLTVTSMVISLEDSSTTTGLGDELGNGWAWSSEASVQYRLGDLPGGTNIGAVYIWDAELFNFGGRFTFNPGEGIVPPTRSDTWIAYLSGWQYVFVKDENPAGPLDLANGEPDREGFGVFWRAGIADNDVNPTQWSLSGGVGGKGMVPGRRSDFFGVGYYYNSIQTTRVSGLLGIDDHTQGFEAFYNVALTPAAQLTFDAQFVQSAPAALDTGVILGVRLKIEL